MKAVFAEGGRERILERALALADAGRDARTETLLEAVVQRAVQLCSSPYISEAMEAPLAELLAARLSGVDQAVSQVKRGDTTITYGKASGLSDLERQLLAPFIRLRSPKGRWRR